jgi:hypothetical protein
MLGGGAGGRFASDNDASRQQKEARSSLVTHGYRSCRKKPRRARPGLKWRKGKFEN